MEYFFFKLNMIWKPGYESGSWRELSAIYAREWVVIITNYAYMMTTPEYAFIMRNFSKIFGGELYDNNRVKFTPEKYLSEEKRFKQPHNFVCGRSKPSVGGLGGGNVWGVVSLELLWSLCFFLAVGSQLHMNLCTVWDMVILVT